jgi:hypothetical protein
MYFFFEIYLYLSFIFFVIGIIHILIFLLSESTSLTFLKSFSILIFSIIYGLFWPIIAMYVCKILNDKTNSILKYLVS